MKRLALGVLLPATLVLAPAPSPAAMTQKKANRAYHKWQERLADRRTDYVQAAGRSLYLRKTLKEQKKHDAPREQIKATREKLHRFTERAGKLWKGVHKAQHQVRHWDRVRDRLRERGGLHAGKGWGGSQGVADAAKRIARRMGLPVTSQKRTLAQTIAVGSSTASDHYVGNTTAFAVDFGVSGSRGDVFAKKLAHAYRIPTSAIGTFNGYYIRVDGLRFRIQLLWRVSGHYDHVHIGIRRA